MTLAGGVARSLRELGASGVFCIGASRGTGKIPDPPAVALDSKADTLMGAIRQALSLLRNLPDEVVDQLDAWDPERRARVITPFFDHGRPVAGRPVYGARLPSWQALEDKTMVDGLWEALGVPHAPFRVVRPGQIAAVAPSLDQGSGVVGAGDSRGGFNGAAEYVRWLRSGEDIASATAFFAERCDRVRVMPFLEGIPCSIHGIVLPDHVAVLRPMEMIVFRRPLGSPRQSELQYAAAASVWDPPEADREEMRALARRVGSHLREAYGYRGTFTIDGVMTVDGFRPTELNPRLGAALMVMTAPLPELPLLLLNDALVEGEPLDWQAEALEALVLETADTQRQLLGGLVVDRVVQETVSQPFLLANGGVMPVDEDGDGVITLGPGPTGGYLRVSWRRLPEPGAPGAPLVLKAIQFANRRWDLGLDPLEPASQVR